MLPWLGVAASALAALVAVASVFVASSAESTARRARGGAQALLEARVAVAHAQEKLGTTDLDDALDAARSANATAQKVGRITRRIVGLLVPTERTAAAAQSAAARGVRSATVARRQTQVAARVLALIAGYQSTATRQAGKTNAALRRILVALRKTNESFPPGPLP